MAPKSYQYTPDGFKVTQTMKDEFTNDGYVLLRGVFNNEEVKHVERALTEGPFSDHTYGVPDGAGKEAHVIVWEHPGNDVTGMVARCDKIAGTADQLLGGEVYHYHSKLMKKPAGIGGKHVWHQDYGYWYKNGLLFPDLMTVFIAIDKCTKENSCLQVLKGSNKCGRIEHGMVGDRSQIGANVQRVEEIAKVCPKEFIEMDPGDVLFFHCNLLHCSSDNTSTSRRWALLTAYNRADNDPVIKHYHPNYTPLIKVDNDAILNCTDFHNMDGKIFLNFEKDYMAGRKIPASEQ